MAVDSYTEMDKYSSLKDVYTDPNINSISLYDHNNNNNNMKLFRAQRNTYLTFFTIFVGLVIFRTLLFITQIQKLRSKVNQN